ncbi:ATP-binding protein [Phaeodactylibacter xiamenensis]|uniref:GAF domain-containing hybrid sensor histidine kinase/response regulator n=1 Tax=Phaeodactylibacter xiamenensis TaxID=1524460 RepID=UPI003CCBBC50
MSQSLPIPPNEEERLKALASYQIMDTLAEKEFDNLTRIASHIFDAPIALITLLDDERQWFKSKIGLEAEGTPREVSFCQYAIVDGETLIVNDAHEDKRFEDNPLVTGNPNIRFYAGHPITNEQGHSLGTLCVIDDKPRSATPEQIELLKGLAETAMSLIACRKINYRLEIYKRFFDESLNLMCIVDMQGICREINPFFMKKLGWEQSQLLSRPLMDFFHPDDQEQAYAQLAKLNEGEPAVEFENRLRKKDGSYIWVQWNCQPDPAAGQMFAIAYDITPLKEKNAALHEAIHHKDIFLSNMSHEIRTPMNAIIGFSDLMERTKLGPTQREYLDAISVAGNNLLAIINDILDLSKIEAGKIDLESKPLELKKVIQDAIKLSQSRAKEKGLRLRASLDMNAPEYIMGDPTRLHQILVNLISNAVKFTNEGSVTVDVEVKDRDEEHAGLCFKVSDTGIGISEEDQERIFNRFEQARQPKEVLFGGTGLGLSIVKMLVELHGGHIEVESQLGEGTTFSCYLRLPIAQSPEKPKATNVDTNSPLKLSGVRILLAEDNKLNQKLGSFALKNNGAIVEFAEDGEAAVEMAQKQAYDIILMDLQMPKMNGYKATEEIRKNLKVNTPIIACTAHSLVGERTKCIEAGMNDYISKPYTEAVLIEVIQQALREK